MPVHDWTRVEAGIFHDHHLAWIAEIRKALNEGLLPNGFYALAEQHAGRSIPDILTLHLSPPSTEPLQFNSASGGTAVAEAPPRMRRHESLDPTAKGRRRTLAIRHVSGHRLIALLEIISPANKDRRQSVEALVAKVEQALDAGVHVGIVDLFPPGPHDPHCLPAAIRERLTGFNDEFLETPISEPLMLASYVAGPSIEIYSETLAPGMSLPEMPLFLNRERYVSLPLEVTYLSAYEGMPAFWRDVLEGRLAMDQSDRPGTL